MFSERTTISEGLDSIFSTLTIVKFTRRANSIVGVKVRFG